MTEDYFKKLAELRARMDDATQPSGPTFEDSLKPWAERTGDQFWAGRTEREALDEAQEVHNSASRIRNRWDRIDHIQSQLGLGHREAELFGQTVFKNPQGRSRFETFGEAHTAAQEEMLKDWMTLSDSETPTRVLTNEPSPNRKFQIDHGRGATDPQATDLIKGNKLIDVQNIFSFSNDKNPSLTLGVISDNAKGSRLNLPGLFDEAPDSETLRQMVARIKKMTSMFGEGKLLQSTKGPIGGRPDLNMSSRVNEYGKDFLIGSVHDKGVIKKGFTDPRNPKSYKGGDFTNLTPNINVGPYNPQPGKRVYAADLEQVREGILDLPKSELIKLNDTGSIVSRKGYRGELKLNLPLKAVEQFGGTDPVRHGLLSSEVLQKAIDASKGFRMAGVALGAIPVLGDAADASIGTYEAVTKKGDAQKRGAGNAAAGITGLAAVAAPAAAPVLAPISGGLAAGNAIADATKKRRSASKKYTSNAGLTSKHIHTAESPVTIQGPSKPMSETQRRRAARRGTGGGARRPVPGANAGAWWNKALGALGLN